MEVSFASADTFTPSFLHSCYALVFVLVKVLLVPFCQAPHGALLAEDMTCETLGARFAVSCNPWDPFCHTACHCLLAVTWSMCSVIVILRLCFHNRLLSGREGLCVLYRRTALWSPTVSLMVSTAYNRQTW
jgi:hypothetical protein